MGRALGMEVRHLLLLITWKEVKMPNLALTLRRIILNSLGWMKKMSSQLTKSELQGRSIPLLPLRLFVSNRLLSHVCGFPCV
jgi:hypothetical protein